MKAKSFLCALLIICLAVLATVSVSAKTASISVKAKRITAGNSFKIRVTSPSQKIKWKSADKSIAKVTAKAGSKNQVVKVKALKKGVTVITAKIGTQKLKCRVRVKSKPQKPAYQGSGETVYITDTGSKYHRSSCRTLRYSKHAVTLSWAQSNGYTACGICH